MNVRMSDNVVTGVHSASFMHTACLHHGVFGFLIR
jgi:hypothetical protein